MENSTNIPADYGVSFGELKIDTDGAGVYGATFNGTIDVSKISEENGWTYSDTMNNELQKSFKVTEKNDGDLGWTYDRSSYILTITYNKDNNKLDSIILADENFVPVETVSFANTYTENIVSMEIPFEKKVTLGGELVPKSETFSLEIVEPGINSNVAQLPQMVYESSVTTNGVGNYIGTFKITGSDLDIKRILESGFYIREVNGNVKHWTYSDKVYYICSATNNRSDKFAIYKTIEVVDGNRKYYQPTNETVDSMFFENVYTEKSVSSDDKPNENTHSDLKHIEAKAATSTCEGNIEYWYCEDCNKYFSDENCENEISLKDTVISKLPPQIIDGWGQSLTEGENKELAFRSDATYSDFIRVEVDGKTVDEKNYSLKEGSTIVTLNADYVATLLVGEHTIGIVSESGTATTTFTINAKAVNDNTVPAPKIYTNTKAVNNNATPKTGDNSHMALCFALLFVSGGALVGILVYGKKKKYSAK